jgi:AraC family transcriptional regulator of adaptative response / DNA-3-methyladenine glycosylase II
MKLDHEKCYLAICARDRRFDGVFFTGVTTTGVYCRPVCPAKTPKPQNCRFFSTAAAAESAGFRPCLRCRPELSPGDRLLNHDPVHSALASIRTGQLGKRAIGEMAAELNLSERQLRRLFVRELGLPPVVFAQTHRLLFAKHLLQETSLSMIDVALSSGFGSVRRFNTLFRQRYAMTPGEVRRAQSLPASCGATVSLRLAYRPPLAWRELLDFLARRAIRGVETVVENAYIRTVEIEGHRGWIMVEHAAEKKELVSTLSMSLVPVLMDVLSRVRRLFDLDANPEVIAEHLSSDSRMEKLTRSVPGLRVPGAWDGFELAVRAILGQQVSVRGAGTLAARLASRFGSPLKTDRSEVFLTSPGAAALATATPEEIATIGIPLKRAATLHALACSVAQGVLRLEAGAEPERIIKILKDIKGIGDWTAQYIAMRGLHWPDAFPAGDLGLLKACSENGPIRQRELLRMAESWRPWRSYAALYLWSSLSAHAAEGVQKMNTGKKQE